jgi:ABC-type branched-subunit amino acid transport system substrate-binding protein
VRLVDDVAEADAVLLCGPLDWELERFRRLLGTARVLGGVSPGLAGFADLLGADPEGFLAPVQWHPDLGGPAGLEDYVAAQTYAAAVIAARSPELEAAEVRSLRTSTFFGDFELDETGLQVGHKLSVIRWRGGRRELVLAEAA